ncbi:MFS transporter [Mycolicibacterium diernhoferi]|uniref:MFS transporter n=1 Tax=Mycolicibacterium diernhoferi TaxID=1801 RepID=A0A1Q4HAL8_9MYCO|nr:MFS transporter [Mycolicibacterium diernhoferi]OJZ64589.1 MFS transporter [Mycolicibacterium diernhoferi]OPE53143.1 MFS transporter [Mycolicibacterium diernhoferi]PEG51826.1 MFS transporter [Mycolicibacterium diernhoferi]QYL24914.1 MFS transporter [Mycolicibacterium diernhoferi]
MPATERSALTEWRRYGTVPVAAALGYSLGVIHVYSLGVFMAPLQEEFGWSRAQASVGLTIVGGAAAVAALPIGLMVDRMGPRRVGLIGTVLMATAFGLFSTASGTMANWILLWSVLAFASFWVQTTVWTSAVASRFETSRGLAFAVTLSGGSLGAALFPALATAFIGEWGWRGAFAGLGAAWGALVVLAVALFFRGAQDRKSAPAAVAADPAPVELAGVTLREGLRSVTFYRLLLAAGLFAFTTLGVVVHLVPILRDAGTEPLAAAGTAALVGVFSIVGRLGVGLLLDRFSGRVVGACAYLVPIVGAALLLLDGTNPVSQTIAAALFGLTLGAEVDVIAYLAARYFGLRNFGGLFGGLVAALSLGTAFGPLAAGLSFDRFGGYSEFLVLTMVLMGISSAALAGLRPAPVWPQPSGGAQVLRPADVDDAGVEL